MRCLVTVWIAIMLLLVVLAGCDNARLDPDVATAFSERRQEKHLEEQNVILERIAVALEGDVRHGR